MRNWQITTRFVNLTFLLFLSFCGSAQADTPYPSVSYKCLSAEDKLLVTAAMTYVDNSPSLSEPKKDEETCDLSSGRYRIVIEYSQVKKCGVMSAEIKIYHDTKVVIRREMGIGVCYGATNIEDMKVNITVVGKTGEVLTK